MKNVELTNQRSEGHTTVNSQKPLFTGVQYKKEAGKYLSCDYWADLYLVYILFLMKLLYI